MLKETMNSIMREIEDIKETQVEHLEVGNTIAEKQIVNKNHRLIVSGAHFEPVKWSLNHLFLGDASLAGTDLVFCLLPVLQPLLPSTCHGWNRSIIHETTHCMFVRSMRAGACFCLPLCQCLEHCQTPRKALSEYILNEWMNCCH